MRFEHSPVAMIPLVPRLGKFPNFLLYTKPNTASPPSFSRSLSLLAKLSRFGRNHGRRTRDKNVKFDFNSFNKKNLRVKNFFLEKGKF